MAVERLSSQVNEVTYRGERRGTLQYDMSVLLPRREMLDLKNICVVVFVHQSSKTALSPKSGVPYLAPWRLVSSNSTTFSNSRFIFASSSDIH